MRATVPSPTATVLPESAPTGVLPKVRRILVPTDLSSLSRVGIDAAMSLMRGDPDASLALVHVIDPAPVAGITDVGVPSGFGLELCVEQAEDELDRLKQ